MKEIVLSERQIPNDAYYGIQTYAPLKIFKLAAHKFTHNDRVHFLKSAALIKSWRSLHHKRQILLF